MEKRKAKLFYKVLALLAILSMCMQMGIDKVAAASSPVVKYSLHIQDKGWLDYVQNGATAGTTGKSLRAEAIKIQVSGISGGITYRTHIQDDGWTSWSSNGSQSGSTGRNLRMEAIEIKLTGQIARRYDVYYRVHVTYAGWLGWAKNGTLAGSTKCGMQIEAIEIKLSSKLRPLRTSQSSVSKPEIKVKAHVQDLGWLAAVGDGEVAGTTGKGYRLEGVQVQCSDLLGGNGITYRAHMEDEGWQGWKKSGDTAGTVGKSKRMEAIEMKLDGALAGTFDIYYRAHCADYGWLGWACNGESAGTTGGSKQMEAVQVKLLPKNESIDKGGKAFYDLTGIQQSSNVGNENSSWDNLVGTLLANIHSNYYTAGNISARGGYTGQCTWYAYGRFYERNNIALNSAGHAKNWLNDNRNDRRVSVLYGADQIRSNCIAVRTSGTYGHVMYVEYVSYNSGNPEYVYYTECNKDGNGRYDAGVDCVLKKKTYRNFVNQDRPAGYIVAR